MALHDKEAIEVVPGLLIGSLAGALSVKEGACRSMLCLGDEELKKNPMAIKLNLEWKELCLGDDDHTDILSHLHECLSFIEDAPRPVLVYSFFGRSRAPTVVAAYLIFTQKVTSVREALHLIQAKRPQAHPNPSFVRQLGRFAIAAQSCHRGVSISCIPDIVAEARIVDCSMDVELLAQTSASRSKIPQQQVTGHSDARPPSLSPREINATVRNGRGLPSPQISPRTRGPPSPISPRTRGPPSQISPRTLDADATQRQPVSAQTRSVADVQQVQPAQNSGEDRMAALKQRKQQAIADEDFEGAAHLRDEIVELEKVVPLREELEEMKRRAVAEENFELAAKIRDMIRGIIPAEEFAGLQAQLEGRSAHAAKTNAVATLGKRHARSKITRNSMVEKEQIERMEKLLLRRRRTQAPQDSSDMKKSDKFLLFVLLGVIAVMIFVFSELFFREGIEAFSDYIHAGEL